MNYETFFIRRLIRLSRTDAGPGSSSRAIASATRAYEKYVSLFDRTQTPVPSTDDLARSLLDLLGVERSEEIARLPDSVVAEMIDNARMRELLDLNRVLLLTLLQSSPQSQVNLSWLWQAEEESPVLVGNSNDNSSRVAMEGALSDIVAAIWHRFTSSLQRLEDSVLNGYDFCLTKYINFAKKGLTDTGGRPAFQLRRVPRVRRRDLLAHIDDEADLASRYLAASLAYNGAAGTRGRKSARANDFKVNTPGCSKAVALLPTQYYTLPEVELHQVVVTFAYAVLIRDSFVSRRLMSSRLCQLGSIVFEPQQLYRLLANLDLNPRAIDKDIAQSIFFNMHGYFAKGDAVISDALTKQLLMKLQQRVNSLITGKSRQGVVRDPSVNCSLLLQGLVRDQDKKKVFERVRDSLRDFLQADQDISFLFY